MKHKGGHWLVLEECIVHTVNILQAKVTSDCEKIKHVALAVIELR